MIEVEVRANVDDFETIKRNLESCGAKYINSIKQTDTVYFIPKFMDAEGKVVDGGIIARLRDVDGKVALQLKEISRLKGGIELSYDVKDTNSIKGFLSKLGFQEGLTIRKSREAYSCGGFVVSLDDVENAGTYVEVEKIVSSEAEKQAARDECVGFLGRIAPGAQLESRMYGDIIKDNQKNSKH